MLGTDEVDRDVRFVADDPAVVRDGRDVERLAGPELDDPAVGEGRRRGAGQDEPDVLHRAALADEPRADVLRPAPAGMVGRPADRLPADGDQLEPAERHLADLVRLLEAT